MTSTIRSPGSASTARSSSTKWSSTKTCIASATSEAPRASSSVWPSESADARHALVLSSERRLVQATPPSRRGGRWQDPLRNEVQQGQQGSGVLAVRLHDDGLKVEEIETPSPDPGEVLVRVHAAAITRGELEWPVDRLPAIPSYELSGVVVGSGDEVYALTPFDRDGVAAEYAVVPADVLAPRPLRLSHVEAA